jgi:hypothetical protein
MKNRSRMVISLTRGELVALHFEVSSKCHGDPGGDENADTNYILTTGPAKLSVRVDDETVQHQPSAGSDEEARQWAAPPADDADSDCHDSELRTPVDALARAGYCHRDGQSNAERHDADECVGEARVRDAHGPPVDDESAGSAVRQRQHGVLLSNRWPKRATIQWNAASHERRVS